MVAHSYAGFVAYGAGENAAGEIGRLVLLDAFIPLDGETMADHVGERGDQYRASAAKDPAGWPRRRRPRCSASARRTPPGPTALMTPQPVQTYLQPIEIIGAVEAIPDKRYISCTSPGLASLEESKRRIAKTGRPAASWPADTTR